MNSIELDQYYLKKCCLVKIYIKSYHEPVKINKTRRDNMIAYYAIFVETDEAVEVEFPDLSTCVIK